MEWQELLKKFKDFRHIFVNEINLMPKSVRARITPKDYNGAYFYRYARAERRLEITATKLPIVGSSVEDRPEKFIAKVALTVDTDAVWLRYLPVDQVISLHCGEINVHPTMKIAGIPLVSLLPAQWPVPKSSQELAERLGDIFKRQPADPFGEHYIVIFNPDILWSQLQGAYFDILEGFQQLWERGVKKAKDSEWNYWFLERRAKRAETALMNVIRICVDSRQTVGASKVLKGIREIAGEGIHCETNIRTIVSKELLSSKS